LSKTRKNVMLKVEAPPPPDTSLRVLPVTVLTQTVGKLREAILTGVFEPGERLVESDLCQRLGVSRPSLREALRRLEAERLVTLVPNRGPLVTEISWQEAQQIYHVRALLEGEAAALCAAREASWPGRQQLRQALEEFRLAVKQDNALERLAATGRFYAVILSGCGNKIIAEVLEGLVARINFLRAQSMSRKGRAEKSAEEMRRICSAIAAADSDGARKHATWHVHQACRAAQAAYRDKTEARTASRT
jgi:DNA-binding GntR family transcriptional regulator